MIKSVRSPDASPTCSLIDFPFVNNNYNKKIGENPTIRKQNKLL